MVELFEYSLYAKILLSSLPHICVFDHYIWFLQKCHIIVLLHNNELLSAKVLAAERRLRETEVSLQERKRVHECRVLKTEKRKGEKEKQDAP